MFRSYTDCVRTIQDDSQSNSNQCSSEGYVCDMCPKDSVIYISEMDVELHRKRDHFQEIEQLRLQYKERFCTVCMKIQPNYSSLITHLKTEHLLSSPMAKRIEREIYICDYCNNIFFNKDILEIHIQCRHLYTMAERRNRYFKCPRCGKISSLLNVWFHFQQHNVSSVSVCDICSSTFPNKDQLHEHLKSHPPLYRCDTCLYTTHKESLYTSHLEHHESRVIKRMRKVDRSLKKIFRMTKKDVYVRFNIHNLLKGVSLPNVLRICILCREICTDKIDMKTHVLRDHMFKETTVKIKYVCVCGEEFTNKILIKQHVFKLKGTHRILEKDEFPETFNTRSEEEDESSPENSPRSEHGDDQPIFVVETLGGTLQYKDTENEIISTNNHSITTNNENENTDISHSVSLVMITRLTEGQTENNKLISTEKPGGIVITRVGNKGTDLDKEMTTDSQIMTTDNQIMTTDSQIMTTDNQIMTTDSQKMITDSQITTDSQKMITDSQINTDSLEMITDNLIMTADSEKMITDSQITTTDSQKMITDSQIMTTDSQKMITDSQMTTYSSKMITDSQSEY